MRLFAGSVIAGACLLTVATATAKEVRLDDTMLDRVTAGTLVPEDSIFAILNLQAIGQAAALAAVGLEQQFEEAQPGATPPPQLTEIIGFLNQVAIDRGVDPISPPNGDNGGTETPPPTMNGLQSGPGLPNPDLKTP